MSSCPPYQAGLNWPPTPASLNTKPLSDQDLNAYDASFPLLPPPLLPHPAVIYAPHLAFPPPPIAYVEQKPAKAKKLPSLSTSTTKAVQPPSPLSLSDAEMEDADATEEDADIYQPDRGSSKAGTSANVTGNARPSAARKASHSVIERRRRERINETLSKLVELVPGCKSALQAKDAKAARSRRRTKKASALDASALNVGGLHKLDVLLATVDYIEELHTRLEKGAQTSTASDSSVAASPAAFTVAEAPKAAIRSTTEDVTTAAASLLALASPIVQPVKSPLVSPIREIQI